MKKRLLFVCSSLDTGGAQKLLSNIVMAMPEEWNIDIVLNSDENIRYPYKGQIISLGIKEPRNRQSLFYQSRVFLRRIRKLRQMRKKNDYKASISFLDSSNIANIMSAGRDSKTIITSVVHLVDKHDQWVYRFVVFPLIRALYNRADKLIVQTSQMKKEMISCFGIKEELVDVIPSGIDMSAIEKMICRPLDPKDSMLFNRNRTVLTAGRLEKNKGQWHLIKAFSIVKETVEDAKLVIFGEGMLYDYLKEMIQEYDLSDSVFIKPFNPELDKYIANSAVFAFPSQYEGMPLALIEALSCGTACIATAFGSGAAEILGYQDERTIEKTEEVQYGLVTSLCSEWTPAMSKEIEPEEKMLAEGIQKLLLNQEYREKYSRRAKERGSYYDMKNVIKKWLRVIEGS